MSVLYAQLYMQYIWYDVVIYQQIWKCIKNIHTVYDIVNTNIQLK